MTSVQIENNENNSIVSQSNSIDTSLLTSEGGCGSSHSPEVSKGRSKKSSMLRKTRKMLSFRKSKNNTADKSPSTKPPLIPCNNNTSNVSIASASSSSCNNNGSSKNLLSDKTNNGADYRESNDMKDEFDSYLAEVAVHTACMVLEKGGGDIATAQDSALSILLKGMKNYKQGIFIVNNTSNKKKLKQQKKKMIEDDALQAASIAVTALSTNISNKQVVDLVINTFNMQGYKCSPYYSRDITTHKNGSNSSSSSSSTSSLTRAKKERREQNTEKDTKGNDDEDPNDRTASSQNSNEEEKRLEDKSKSKQSKMTIDNQDNNNTTPTTDDISLKNDIDIQKDRMKRLMSISKSSSSLLSEEFGNANEKHKDAKINHSAPIIHQPRTKQKEDDCAQIIKNNSQEIKHNNSNGSINDNKVKKTKRRDCNSKNHIIHIPSLMSITSADNTDTEEDEADNRELQSIERNNDAIVLKHKIGIDTEDDDAVVSTVQQKQQKNVSSGIRNNDTAQLTKDNNDSTRQSSNNINERKKTKVTNSISNKNISKTARKENNKGRDVKKGKDQDRSNISDNTSNIVTTNANNINENNNNARSMFCVSPSSMLPTCRLSYQDPSPIQIDNNNSNKDVRQQQEQQRQGTHEMTNENNTSSYVKSRRFRSKKKGKNKINEEASTSSSSDNPEMSKKAHYKEKERRKEEKIRKVIRALQTNNGSSKEINYMPSYDSDTETKVKKVL